MKYLQHSVQNGNSEINERTNPIIQIFYLTCKPTSVKKEITLDVSESEVKIIQTAPSSGVSGETSGGESAVNLGGCFSCRFVAKANSSLIQLSPCE